MSTLYYVREVLSVNRKNKSELELGNVMSYQLSLLGGLMLQGIAKVYDLSLECDEGAKKFSGDVVTAEYQEILRCIDNSEHFTLDINYGYTRFGLNPLSHDAGPFTIMNTLKESNISEIKDDFYSVWFNEDSSSDEIAYLYAYGKHNGNSYWGEVDYHPVELDGASGKWATPGPDMCFDEEIFKSGDIEGKNDICRKIAALGETDCEPGENYGDIFMNTVYLNNIEEIHSYISLVSKLMSMDSHFCGSNGFFIDRSGEQNRLMKIDIKADESAEFYIAQI